MPVNLPDQPGTCSAQIFSHCPLLIRAMDINACRLNAITSLKLFFSPRTVGPLPAAVAGPIGCQPGCQPFASFTPSGMPSASIQDCSPLCSMDISVLFWMSSHVWDDIRLMLRGCAAQRMGVFDLHVLLGGLTCCVGIVVHHVL